MSLESPPFAIQATGLNYTAEQTRRAMFAAFARTSTNSPGILAGGLLGSSDIQISAPASGMSVNVSAGEAIIGGSEGGTQGAYYGRVSSTTNLSISPANASNPRVDTICLTVSDSNYTEPTGGSGNQVALQVVTGTATSGATLSNLLGVGTLPASSLLIGYCLVPAAATNIVSGDIANKAQVVRLGAAGLNYLQLLTATAADVQYGHLAAVSSDTGGWCNYSLPAAFPTQIDVVLAMNGFGGSSSAAFQAVQPNPSNSPQSFRAFVNSSGLSCDCYYIAVGH